MIQLTKGMPPWGKLMDTHLVNNSMPHSILPTRILLTRKTLLWVLTIQILVPQRSSDRLLRCSSYWLILLAVISADKPCDLFVLVCRLFCVTFQCRDSFSNYFNVEMTQWTFFIYKLGSYRFFCLGTCLKMMFILHIMPIMNM